MQCRWCGSALEPTEQLEKARRKGYGAVRYRPGVCVPPMYLRCYYCVACLAVLVMTEDEPGRGVWGTPAREPVRVVRPVLERLRAVAGGAHG